MSHHAEISRDGGTLLVRVPLKRRQRGGGRLMIADGAPVVSEAAPVRPSSDPILKALGRAWRWKRIMESGDYPTIGDLAAAEKVHKAYLCRLLHLTRLSPAIAESICDGTLSKNVLLADLLDSFLVDWGGARAALQYLRSGVPERKRTRV